MNVEVSAKIENVKYLHKYLVKMPDRADVTMQVVAGENYDETKVFSDGRYISTSEAVWRALCFPVHYQSPPVKRLAVHLEGEEMVLFDQNTAIEEALQKRNATSLVAWLENNASDDEKVVPGRKLLYPDYPTACSLVKGK